MDPDPIERFEHDHARLSTLVLRVQELLEAIERDGPGLAEGWRDVGGRIEELEESLVAHFAREEEALFPFLMSEAPSLAEAVEALRASHDEICGVLARLASTAQSERPREALFPAIRGLFEQFVASYASHSRGEHDLLEQIAASLGEQQALALREVLRGI
jgi:iron-sulfur cluster repair protein YtfE (RIC family)